MCCLFGLIDYRRNLSARQKNHMLDILAAVCEARGTDAAGIAYNAGGKMRIYKRPWPAHLLRFHVPAETRVVMGHTRMTTQGCEQKNRNNHPFPGQTREGAFALAHNGILHNDKVLRQTLHLPNTNVETDSYIAVQLIQSRSAVNFESLRYTAEALEGSFCFSILDSRDNLYLVKGDNPLCLYHFPARGLYLYASTKPILQQALADMGLSGREGQEIPLECGEILRIRPSGATEQDTFHAAHLFHHFWRECAPSAFQSRPMYPVRNTTSTYLEEIKKVACAFGYTPEDIDQLAACGFSPEEVEELLYCGEI